MQSYVALGMVMSTLVCGVLAQDCDSAAFVQCFAEWVENGCQDDAGVEKMGPEWFARCEDYADCVTPERIQEACDVEPEPRCLSDMEANGEELPEGVGLIKPGRKQRAVEEKPEKPEKPEYPALKLHTGAMMPQIGFGTFLAAPGEVGPAVKTALEVGYRHIDCAAVYGNEKEIGEVFEAVFSDPTSGIKREDVFITSKLAPTVEGPEGVIIALKQTLADLKLDYLDLYLIHQPLVVEPNPDYDGKHRIIGKFRPVRHMGWGMQDIWRAMEDGYEAGLTKAIGISNFNAQMINDVLTYAKVAPAVQQIERHPYLAQPEITKFCQANDIVVTGYAPLGAPGSYGADAQDSLLTTSVIKEIADKYSKTSAQVLIRWAIDSGSVSIPKSVKPHRIAENFNVLDFHLSTDELVVIAGLNSGTRLFNQDWMGVPTFF